MGLGGDPPRSLYGRGHCPLIQNFRFLILKRHIFVDCLALKFIFITKRCPNDRTHGMQCMVVDGGRVIIRSKPFIDNEVIWAMGFLLPPRGLKFTRARGSFKWVRGFNPPPSDNSSTSYVRLLALSGGIVITQVCWLVGSFVRSFVRFDISKSTRPICMKFVTEFKHHKSKTLLTLRGQGQISRSKPLFRRSSHRHNTSFRLVPLLMTLKDIWRSFQSKLSFTRPLSQKLYKIHPQNFSNLWQAFTSRGV